MSRLNSRPKSVHAATQDESAGGNQERYLSAVIPESGGGDFCKTYILKKQGHTLGNSLKFVIEHYQDVQFCGYTQPHPGEDLIHFRLQTIGTPADAVLKRGFEDLKSLCEIVEDKFQADLDRFVAASPTQYSDHPSS